MEFIPFFFFFRRIARGVLQICGKKEQKTAASRYAFGIRLRISHRAFGASLAEARLTIGVMVPVVWPART